MGEFGIHPEQDLRSGTAEKVALFKHYSKTKKQVFLTFISTYGVLENEHSRGVVDRELGLGELFGEKASI